VIGNYKLITREILSKSYIVDGKEISVASARRYLSFKPGITRPPHAASAGLLLWARRVGDISRLLHGRRSAAEMRAVSCCQLTNEADHRLVRNVQELKKDDD